MTKRREQPDVRKLKYVFLKNGAIKKTDSSYSSALKAKCGKFCRAVSMGLVMIIIYGVLIFFAVLGLGPYYVECYTALYFGGIIGVPSAIIVSIMIMGLFASMADGIYKISVLKSVEFEGPAVPLTMWVVCFLVIVFAINLLTTKYEDVKSLPIAIRESCEYTAASAPPFKWPSWFGWSEGTK